MQLDGLEARYPSQLSGGQRQRVALARALAIEPRVLLLDEPFGALDAKVRKDLRKWLREMHDRTGHTTLFVTHDQDEAFELADRIAILNHGKIEQIGTAAEIVRNPTSDFVADFIQDVDKTWPQSESRRQGSGYFSCEVKLNDNECRAVGHRSVEGEVILPTGHILSVLESIADLAACRAHGIPETSKGPGRPAIR